MKDILLGILILFANTLTYSQESNYNGDLLDNQLKNTVEDSGLVVFDMSHSGISQGNVDIPVYILSPYDVTALDFSLKFNQKKLEYVNILNAAGYIKPVFFYNEEDSTLRFTSYSFQTYKTNENLVSIRFKLKKNNITESDLKIILTIFGDTEYNDHIVPSDVTPYIPTTSISDNIMDQNVKIFPNPASEILNIDVPENSNVQIFDISGKQVILETTAYNNQILAIDVKDLTVGVYLVKVSSENFAKVQKVVITR